MATTTYQTVSYDDPIVTEIRKAGDEMAREADYDLHTLCERLRESERQHPERLVKTPLHNMKEHRSLPSSS